MIWTGPGAVIWTDPGAGDFNVVGDVLDGGESLYHMEGEGNGTASECLLAWFYYIPPPLDIPTQFTLDSNLEADF